MTEQTPKQPELRTNVEWSDGLEEVLRKEGEEAESFFWGHTRASVIATRTNDMINIPSIVIQTVTGFLTAANNLVPSIALGALSVFSGILSTILSYYKFSARAEAHKMSAQLYLKIYKKLEIELSLPQEQRMPPLKLLEEIRDKLARVSEVAPPIPESVIAEYKIKFKDNLSKAPIIFNGLDVIKVHHQAPLTIDDKIKIRITAPPS